MTEKSKMPKYNKIIQFWRWFELRSYTILYIIMLCLIWRYVLRHWDQCISMQFFTKFDGNNILFILGLLLMILPFYDVEAKEFKLHRRTAGKIENKFQSADSTYQQDMISHQIRALQSENSLESNEEIVSNELSN